MAISTYHIWDIYFLTPSLILHTPQLSHVCVYVTLLKQSLSSPFKVISKAPVDIHWFSIMLLRKKTIMQAYTWKRAKIHRPQPRQARLLLFTGASELPL